MRYIPNFLSSLRVIIAIAFPFQSPQMRLPLVLAALLTEFFDGALARRYKWVTSLGQLLDPFADKLFTLSVGLTLLVESKLLLWQLLLISVRDIAVTLGFFWYLFFFRKIQHITDFKPNMFGKITTALQYLTFLVVVFYGEVPILLLVMTGISSIFAAISYFLEFTSRSNEKTKSIHL